MVRPRFRRSNPVQPRAQGSRTTQQGITVKVNRTNMVGITNNISNINNNSKGKDNSKDIQGSISINRIDREGMIRMMKGEFLYLYFRRGLKWELFGDGRGRREDKLSSFESEAKGRGYIKRRGRCWMLRVEGVDDRGFILDRHTSFSCESKRGSSTVVSHEEDEVD